MSFNDAMKAARAKREATEQQRKTIARQGGNLNAAMVCPHCQTRGKVAIRPETVKAGISGGKAVAAVLTAGLSMLTPGVGLSRKQHMTRATCASCRSTWLF